MINPPNYRYINSQNKYSAQVIIESILRGRTKAYIHSLRDINSSNICIYWFLARINDED